MGPSQISILFTTWNIATVCTFMSKDRVLFTLFEQTEFDHALDKTITFQRYVSSHERMTHRESLITLEECGSRATMRCDRTPWFGDIGDEMANRRCPPQ